MAEAARAQTVFSAIGQQLRRGRQQEAVRIVVDGVARRLLPSDSALPGMLSKQLGAPAFSKLVQGFATFPCFYCRRGLQECLACVGRGTSHGGWVCETCVGLGISRCDFCDGAGWVTYSIVPEGLRPHVIAERVSLARKGLKSLLAQSNPDERQGRRAVARHLMELNRLCGVFENASVAIRAIRLRSKPMVAIIRRIEKACLTAWKSLKPRMKLAVQALERLEAKDLARETGTSARQRLERRVAFYHRIARSAGFDGTSLHHPFLCRLR